MRETSAQHHALVLGRGFVPPQQRPPRFVLPRGTRSAAATRKPCLLSGVRPASATPAPAPWQDPDVVGVDVFPARPPPVVLPEPQVSQDVPVVLLPGACSGQGACPQPVSTCVCRSQPRDPLRQALAFLEALPAVLIPPFPRGTGWVWGALCPELDACTWPGQPCRHVAESHRVSRPGSQEAAATLVVPRIPQVWFVSRRERSGPWRGLLVVLHVNVCGCT